MSGYKQIFILGAPRSGTTFLASLLEKTEYSAPIETHFITKYYKKLPIYGELSKPYNFKRLIKNILSERPVQQWELDLDLDNLYKEISPDFSFSNICNILVTKRKSEKIKNSWGDKTPHYIKEMEILVELFPDAKFIYIYRDGRDVAISLLKKPWGPNNYFSCAKSWAESNNKDSALEKVKSNNQLHSVKYENLVENTEEELCSIYHFLENKISEKDIKRFSNYSIAKNFNKWETKMTSYQLRVFEATAGSCLVKLGYNLSCKSAKLSSIEVFLFTTHDILLKIIHLLKINIIDNIKIRFLGKKPFNE